MDPGAHRGQGQGNLVHAGRPARDPEQADRGRGLREVPRPEIHRYQALRPRWRRVDGPGSGADHQARRRARRRGDRPRHGPSRPAERAHQRDGQAVPGCVPRVQGRLGLSRGGRGLGRREVPSRRLLRPRLRRQHRPPLAHRQPVPPRDRRSGGAGEGAGQAGPEGQAERRAPQGAAAPDPRRRGVCRPGRGGGVLRPVGPQRAPHRRLDPLHHQQPDRLHHRPAVLALLALSVRRGEDGRGADLPLQRRRPRGRDLRRQGRDRVPPEIRQAGRDRHAVLPPLRPQRGRRAGLHPAEDVPADPQASDRAGDLRQEARRAGRRDPGAARRAQGRVPLDAGGRARRRRRLQAEQGRLARRALVRLQGGARGRGRSPPRPHRRAGGDPARHRHADHHAAAGLPPPPHDPALLRQPRQGGRDRCRHRLGDGGSAGLRLAADRGPPCPPLGPGRGARHLLAAPRRGDRSGERAALHAAQLRARGAGEPGGHQLDALRGGGARLRVRLLAGRAELPGAVGGAVRRLRQRRAGGHRPVHQ
ncbi:hypothetical protein CHKEEEPN_3006 [Methylorubrum podarium]|nr:hypothetical protein CHKEEEPN_3006 [Methylorubrum podarium]